jgi:hypothetical protein
LSRQQSTAEPRSRARDTRAAARSLDRLARIEAALDEMRITLDVQFKRIAAVQAQLDHLAAKVGGR